MLAACQSLQSLSLSFRGYGYDWAGNTTSIAAIAEKVNLPQLHTLELDGIRCAGDGLTHFLRRHSTLRGLTLMDSDIEGCSTAAHDVLETIVPHHADLTRLEWCQIAQNGRRIETTTEGLITDGRMAAVMFIEPDDPEGEALYTKVGSFWDDFVFVGKPKRYHVVVEEWEGRARIDSLGRDLSVTAKSLKPENDDGTVYIWRE